MKYIPHDNLHAVLNSLPLWERGLKSLHFSSLLLLFFAPLVGAWIEIQSVHFTVRAISVAPLVGAWIEIHSHLQLSPSEFVAPLVGAWIEIFISSLFPSFTSVAPLVGAWIEIYRILLMPYKRRSLPLWERGLKLCAKTVVLK